MLLAILDRNIYVFVLFDSWFKIPVCCRSTMIILFTVQAVVPQVNIKSLQAEVAQLKKENEQIDLLKEEIEGE